jgi:hypothetical protein
MLGSWSAPDVLASAGAPARSPVLAATASGQAIVGWLGGPPPPPRAVPPRARASVAGWEGETVFVDRGTLQTGFSAPAALTGPVREDLQLKVAVAGSGTAYAVWGGYAGPTVVSAAAPGGSFAAPRELLPSGDLLLAVLQSPGGPVAAVWTSVKGPAGSPIRYALLRPDGSRGRTVTMGRLLVPAFGVHFALNDSGELATVGVTNNGAPGLPPTRPVLVLCSPRGSCSRPRAMQLGAIGHTDQQIEDTVALSKAGTLTVFADADSSECRPAARPCGGLWATVRAPDRHWMAPHDLGPAQDAGQMEGASDGSSAAVVLDRPFGGGTPQWSGLEAGGARITAPATLLGPAGYVRPQEVAPLAANTSGRFVIAGCTSPAAEARPQVFTPCDQVQAALGAGDVLEPPQPLLPEQTDVTSVSDAIDGAGEAAVIWSYADQAIAQSEPRGVSIAVHSPANLSAPGTDPTRPGRVW